MDADLPLVYPVEVPAGTGGDQPLIPGDAVTTPYELARTQIGQAECHGPNSNIVIDGYLASVGALTGNGDETSWCSAFVQWCCQNATPPVEGTGRPNARSWLVWGVQVPPGRQREGDVCVLWRGDPRGWQGHVGFYVRRTIDERIILLAGNQGDRVCEASFAESRVLAYRRPA